MRRLLVGFGCAAGLATALTAQVAKPSGVALADLTWKDAEPVLTESAVVVLPLGAAAVEHGPHMRLSAGETLARYLAGRVQASASVVVAPPLTYHFFPAFAEYPGSTSLTRATARDATVEIVSSLARYGPRRFYVLNTGAGALGPLSDAARVLSDGGILLGYTDISYRIATADVQRSQRPVSGTAAADEIETSMMLVVDPESVDMRNAVAEYGAGTGPLTRVKDAPGVFSSSGVRGDATVASAEKGRVLLDAIVSGVLDDIEK